MVLLKMVAAALDVDEELVARLPAGERVVVVEPGAGASGV